jgi:hypothetical protein
MQRGRTDSNLSFAVGLLCATVMAGLAVLLLPALAKELFVPKAPPTPIMASKLVLEPSMVPRKLPRAQSPPPELLDPSIGARGPIP